MVLDSDSSIVSVGDVMKVVYYDDDDDDFAWSIVGFICDIEPEECIWFYYGNHM